MLLSNQKSKQNEIGLAKKKKSSVGTGQLFPVNFPRLNKKKKKKKETKRKRTHTHIGERLTHHCSAGSWITSAPVASSLTPHSFPI